MTQQESKSLIQRLNEAVAEANALVQQKERLYHERGIDPLAVEAMMDSPAVDAELRRAVYEEVEAWERELMAKLTQPQEDDHPVFPALAMTRV